MITRQIQSCYGRSVADAEDCNHDAPLNLGNTLKESVGVFTESHHDGQCQEEIDRDKEREKSDCIHTEQNVLQGNCQIERNDQNQVVAASRRCKRNEFAKRKERGERKDEKQSDFAKVKSNGKDNDQRPGGADSGIDDAKAVGSDFIVFGALGKPAADDGTDRRQNDQTGKNREERFLIGNSESHVTAPLLNE